jgi:hypothetical protein
LGWVCGLEVFLIFLANLSKKAGLKARPFYSASPASYMGLVSREDSSPRTFQGDGPASGEPMS